MERFQIQMKEKEQSDTATQKSSIFEEKSSLRMIAHMKSEVTPLNRYAADRFIHSMLLPFQIMLLHILFDSPALEAQEICIIKYIKIS